MTSSPEAGASGRLVSIQILRGVAALLVVALHLNVSLRDLEPQIGPSHIANFASWYQFGGIGVDIFFVISGFVMAFTMKQYGDRPGAFIRQRFLRIAPLCYFVTGIWLLILIVGDRPFTTAGVISGLTFLPVMPAYTEPTFRVLWTLSFEFAFYFLVFCALGLRLGPRQLFSITCAAGTFGLIWVMPLPLLRWFTHPVLLEFSLGIAAFVMWREKAWRRPVLLASGSLGAGLLLIQALWLPLVETNPTFMIEAVTVLPRLIFWGIPSFLVLSLLLEWRPSDSGMTRAAQAIGDASYAIYLVHLIPVYGIVSYVPLAPDARWLIGFLSSVGLGLAVHRWIEKPMTRFALGRTSRNRREPPDGLLIDASNSARLETNAVRDRAA